MRRASFCCILLGVAVWLASAQTGHAARVTTHIGLTVGSGYGLGVPYGYPHHVRHRPGCHCPCCRPHFHPPVYVYPPVIAPVPAVVVPPPVIYRRYYYYGRPSAVFHYRGRNFGLSIGF